MKTDKVKAADVLQDDATANEINQLQDIRKGGRNQ